MPYLISGETKEIKDLLATPVGVMRYANFFRAVKDIAVLTGKEAVAIDRDKKQVKVRDRASGQEETYPYDKLVLATGANPVRPKIPGIDAENVFWLRKPEDGLAIQAAKDTGGPGLQEGEVRGRRGGALAL